MLYTLNKEITFESAHRLSKGYPDKCRNIHGHSWKVTLFITVDTLNSFDMGVDFGDMKKFLKSIEDKFDHKLILWKDDPLVLLLVNKTSVITTNKNPTSEHIAALILAEASGFFSSEEHVTELKVEVKETCTSGCSVSREVFPKL